jgi:hypothetical protein
MATEYKGAAKLTMVKADGGKRVVYVYAEDPVPQSADAADVARLVEAGFLVPKDGGTDPANATDEDGGGQSGTGPSLQGGASGETGSPSLGSAVPGGSATKPNVNAPKADWVEYAVSQGATREDAESSTKDQLVDKYGR